MFRKNFREGGGGKSGGGCGGGGGLKGSKSFASSRNNASKQRARDMSLSLQDDVHYRTHLFFSPTNRGYNADNEGEFELLMMVALHCAFCSSIYPSSTPSLFFLLFLFSSPFLCAQRIHFLIELKVTAERLIYISAKRKTIMATIDSWSQSFQG